MLRWCHDEPASRQYQIREGRAAVLAGTRQGFSYRLLARYGRYT